MKSFLLTIAVFALAITALHAQVLPGTIPGVDPAIQAAVEAAVPQNYAGYTSLLLVSIMILGRWIKAVQLGTGIKGWFSAIWSGTNTPHILIACLCVLTISSCDTPKTAAQAAKRQQYEKIGDKLLKFGLRAGIVTTEEAADIRELGTLIVPTNPPVVEVTSGK